MTEKSIYLSSWALTEPDDIFYFYQPTWWPITVKAVV